jgi:hypothetical protein
MTILTRILEFIKMFFKSVKALFVKEDTNTNIIDNNQNNNENPTDNDDDYIDDPNLMLFNFYIKENGLIPGKTKELGNVLSGYIKDPVEISNIIRQADMGNKVKVLSKVAIEICWELDAKLRDNGITKYRLNEFGSVLELGTEIESIVNS